MIQFKDKRRYYVQCIRIPHTHRIQRTPEDTSMIDTSTYILHTLGPSVQVPTAVGLATEALHLTLLLLVHLVIKSELLASADALRGEEGYAGQTLIECVDPDRVYPQIWIALEDTHHKTTANTMHEDRHKVSSTKPTSTSEESKPGYIGTTHNPAICLLSDSQSG